MTSFSIWKCKFFILFIKILCIFVDIAIIIASFFFIFLLKSWNFLKKISHINFTASVFEQSFLKNCDKSQIFV